MAVVNTERVVPFALVLHLTRPLLRLLDPRDGTRARSHGQRLAQHLGVHILIVADTAVEKQMREDLAIKFLAYNVRPSIPDLAYFGVGASERT